MNGMDARFSAHWTDHFGRVLHEIEMELDALRSSLGRHLTDLEQRFEQAIDGLPPGSQHLVEPVREAFSLRMGTPMGPIPLGPRAVAIAAANVDKFVTDWLGNNGRLRRVEFDGRTMRSFEADLANVENHLRLLEQTARERARESADVLGQLLEDELAGLEHAREEREAVLDAVVGARADRDMTARLWEEQRRHAELLREAWEPIERILFESHDATASGVTVLRSIMERTMEGVARMHPELSWASDTDPPPPLRSEVRRRPGAQTSEQPRLGRDTDLIQELARSTLELERPAATESEPVEVELVAGEEVCERFQAGWESVGTVETTLGLLPLVGLLAAGGLAAASRLGFDMGVGTFALRAAFVLTAIWLIGFPIARGWRVSWAAWRPWPMRWRQTRQESIVRWDESGVFVADRQYPWLGVEAREGSWRDEHAEGRWLELSTGRGERLAFVCRSQMRDDEPADLRPEAAWELSRAALDELAHLSSVDDLDLVSRDLPQ